MDELVDALAVFRITRLLVDDVILDDTRAAAVDWLNRRGHRKLAYLATCPWCLSPYVAIIVLVARRFRLWRPLALALAASAVTGLLSE